MRTWITTAALVAGLVATAAWTGWVQTASADRGRGDDAASLIAKVRIATAKYVSVEAALADGYRPDPVCVAAPPGAMGVHFENPRLFADGVLDIERPEILLYEPMLQGQFRLVAVEYFQADADQNLATANDRPSLFGMPFDGPMPGHNPVMPAHYDLHVWIWQSNPAGVFAQFNPSVRCGG